MWKSAQQAEDQEEIIPIKAIWIELKEEKIKKSTIAKNDEIKPTR